MRVWFTVLLASSLTTSVLANDSAKVVGTWKLVSFVNEFQDGSEPRGAYGNRPTGYIIFTADGRMMSVVEAEGRKPAENDEQRAAAFRTIIAYTGIYRLEGDKFTTKVDVSWNPAWVGTEQVRDYRLEGNQLKVVSPWVMSPNLGKMTRATVTWERSKWGHYASVGRPMIPNPSLHPTRYGWLRQPPRADELKR